VRLQLLIKFYYHSGTSNTESQFQVLTFQVQVQVQVQVLKNRTVRGCTSAMAQANSEHLLEEQDDKYESQRINRHANTGAHHP